MDKNLNWEIGMRIKQAREQAHLTQEDLSEILGCSPQYISFMETGRHLISLKMLRTFCIALNLSSDSILFSQNDKKRIEMLSHKCDSLSRTQFDLLMDIVDKYIEAVTV